MKQGTKFDHGKPMYSLLPWKGIEQVVLTMNFGVDKYGFENWKRVNDGERRYLDAALRHIVAHLKGERLDPETGLTHLSHAVSSLLFADWHHAEGLKRKRNSKPSRSVKRIPGGKK